MSSISIKVKSHDKKNNSAVLEIKNTTCGFVNSLRRTIMTEVPTLAIEDVEFVKNSSALYDEMVAHRLGLVVLTTDLKTYIPLDKCDNVLSAKNSVKLHLKSKGIGYICADQLKCDDPLIKPVFPKTPIVKLLENQELELECVAVLSRGKEHVKWSPAHVWHTQVPKLKIKQNHPKLSEFKDRYPPQIFKNGKIDEKIIEKENLYDAVDGINKEIIDVEYEKDNFLFHIESFGQLKIKDILISALLRLKEQFESLKV